MQRSKSGGEPAFGEVSYVSGRTRVFGIVGHPIEQVRSPEMITAEMKRRGHDAILVPLHVLPDDFDSCLPNLLKLQNLDGLIFTIPYKVRARGLADRLGAQACIVGAINALARAATGRWEADIFDGIGCVEAFRRRGIGFANRRVMLIGAGGAGSAIGIAIAYERPASIRLYDVDAARAGALAAKIREVDATIAVVVGDASAGVGDVDILLNASPVGMLDDPRLPIEVTGLRAETVVFDAIVKPEKTPLLALAGAAGCTTVTGREMMRGQIAKLVDFFAGERAGFPSNR